MQIDTNIGKAALDWENRERGLTDNNVNTSIKYSMLMLLRLEKATKHCIGLGQN